MQLLANEPLLPNSLQSGPTFTFPEIPQDISDKFLESTKVDTPDTFQDGTNWPLKEGFDALVYHFSRVRPSPPLETRWTHVRKSEHSEIQPGF